MEPLLYLAQVVVVLTSALSCILNSCIAWFSFIAPSAFTYTTTLFVTTEPYIKSINQI